MDGDNPSLTSGVIYGGADIDAAEGIVSYTGVGNITVAHNIVRNVSYAGIDFYNADNTAATSDNLISSNYVDNLSGISGFYGIGVILYNNFYAQVTNNVLDHLRVGVQTGNFSQANSDLGFAPSISGNQIASVRRGIFYNLMYGPSTTFAVQGNTLTAIGDPSNTTGWQGALISSIQSAVGVNFSNNTIDGSGANAATPTTGLEVWNTPSTGSMVLSGDTISGVDNGVWVNSYEGYTSPADATSITLSNENITASQYGVYVEDSSANTGHPSVSAQITGGTISATGLSAVGVYVSGAQASVTMTGVTVDDPVTGVLIDGGSATISGGTIEHNDTGIDVENAGSASISGVTFADNTTDLVIGLMP